MCTDIVGASAIVLPSIADHAGVLVRLSIPEVKETRMEQIRVEYEQSKLKRLGSRARKYRLERFAKGHKMSIKAKGSFAHYGVASFPL